MKTKDGKRDKDIRKFIIICLMLTVVMMSTAFAVYAERLEINGSGTITGEWNIAITGVEETNKVGDAYSIEDATVTSTSVTFNAGLKSPGDSITYEVTVENLGTLDAVLSSINVSEQNDLSASKVIKYELLGDGQGSTLDRVRGTLTSKNKIKIRVYYDDTGVDPSYEPLNTSKSITVSLIYNQD